MQIVSNGFCGIDVDKWDYLLRDSYYLRNVVTIEMAFERCFEGRFTLNYFKPYKCLCLLNSFDFIFLVKRSSRNGRR